MDKQLFFWRQDGFDVMEGELEQFIWAAEIYTHCKVGLELPRKLLYEVKLTQ